MTSFDWLWHIPHAIGTIFSYHGTILEEYSEEVRSGCVGAGEQFIPGPANLHELPGINGEAGNGQAVHDVKRCRQEPLPPVLSELAQDIFHVVFIYEVVVFQNMLRLLPFFHQVKDLLLVMEGNLGVRDKDGRDEGMGGPAFRTEYTLDSKPDQNTVELNTACIVAITDKASLFPAGTYSLVELYPIHHTVILFLRKVIAFFKDNCYHSIVSSTKGHGSWCCREKDRATLVGWTCLFQWALLLQ